MQFAIRIFVGLVSLFLSALEFLILLRAISSWLPFDDDSPLVSFLYFCTEPLLAPIRAILDRFELFRSMPIDMSSMICMFLLMFINLLLPEVRF